MTEPDPPAPSSAEMEGYEPPTPGGWGDYPLDELAIREEKRTTMDVVRRIEKERFVLDPDFQRGFVWDVAKQSRLIESILLRIPLPVFYVAEDSTGRLIVVDGRQRLTTLQSFLSGKLKLNLDDRPDLHGKRFSELDVRLQNRIEDCQLLFYIIERNVPERARLDIFERVNGGEKLTRQQMRNAIYNGPATRFLAEQASQNLFIEATGRSLNEDKMQDREFVNRFCSFWLLPLDTYKGDMDDWLARGLLELAKIPEVERLEISAALQRGLENNFEVFGDHAFRKHKSATQKRSVINASLFDVMITGLARYPNATVRERVTQLREAFYARMNDERFIKSITYGPNTPQLVRHRFAVVKEMLQEVFGAS